MKNSLEPKQIVSRLFDNKGALSVPAATARRSVELLIRDYDLDAYSRGYRAGFNCESKLLENEAFYDGWADRHADRERWHSPLCYFAGCHHNEEGGCGNA